MKTPFKVEVALKKSIASSFGFKPQQIEIQEWDLTNPQNAFISFKIHKINKMGRIIIDEEKEERIKVVDKTIL